MLEIPIGNLDISHCPLFMSLLWRRLWAAGKLMSSTWSAWLGISSPEYLGEHDWSSWLFVASIGKMEGEAYSHTGWMNLFKTTPRTSLVSQWRGVCLSMQRTWVWSVVWEDSTCHGAAAAATASLQSCPTLCDPWDGSPPGSPVPGILQARTLEWVAISFSNAWKWKVKVKSCLTLRDPMDCSPPGSSVHGLFQARVLEWGAIATEQFSPNATTPEPVLWSLNHNYWSPCSPEPVLPNNRSHRNKHPVRHN